MFHHIHQHSHGGRHGRPDDGARGQRFVRGERGERGDFGAHGQHGWHRGRGGLGRFFAHGDLRLVILNLIAEKPRHGYDIIKAIEERVGGAYSPSPGVIYPTLTLLEELGYVTVSAEGESGRKLHAITPQGRAFLDANRPTLDLLLSRMAEAGAQDTGPAPQLLRAMENLKLALRLRLSRGPLTAEQTEAVAALLDTAATNVEKI